MSSIYFLRLRLRSHLNDRLSRKIREEAKLGVIPRRFAGLPVSLES
jgi:hypothetical protein